MQVFHKLEVLVQEPITLAESKEIMSEVDRNRELQVFTFSMVEVPKQSIARFRKMKIPQKYLRATDIKVSKGRGYEYY